MIRSTSLSAVRMYRNVALKGPMIRAVATEARAPKKEGDISSVFSSLSGGAEKPLDARFTQIKRQLIEGREKEITASWKRLLIRLAQETRVITQKGLSVVPEINFKDIASSTKSFEEAVKFRGVAVVRGVLPRDEARAFKSEVEEYVRLNPWTKAFPQDNPAVFELYWSAPQVKARASPNLIATQKYLMSLWHSSDPEALISTSHPLAYADRVRIRQPGDAGFALGPHMDGGSVERWEPDGYGAGGVYDKILAGNWEQYDPWEASGRVRAVSDLHNGAGGCSVFRMFQGWLSMSDTGPNEGTLMVNPLLQLSTAYLLLRPFFTPKRQPTADLSGQVDEAYLSEHNWVLEPETTSTLHGASPGLGQELNTILHPHLDLTSTMVHVPKVQPGDYVVWHCDTIHAVDKQHNGARDSSVMYIPVCPLTELNLDYLSLQRDVFLSGHPGPDFPGGKGESEHHGRPSLSFLQKCRGEDGQRAMGFAKFDQLSHVPGEMRMIDKANSRLGFSGI